MTFPAAVTGKLKEIWLWLWFRSEFLRRGIYKWSSNTDMQKVEEFLFLFKANYYNLCAIKAVSQKPNILTIFYKNINENFIRFIKTRIRIQITQDMWNNFQCWEKKNISDRVDVWNFKHLQMRWMIKQTKKKKKITVMNKAYEGGDLRISLPRHSALKHGLLHFHFVELLWK